MAETVKDNLQKNIKTFKIIQSEVQSINRVALSVDCVIFGFDENKLKVLLIRSDLKKYQSKWSLLGDLVKPNEDLDTAAYHILKQRTGLNDLYLEQVHTFGEVNRHPAGRVVTVAYCSLINIQHHKLKILDNELHWHEVESVTDLAFDHQKIFEACYLWLQKRVQEHPLGLSLLQNKFSLRELQNLYEAILNRFFVIKDEKGSPVLYSLQGNISVVVPKQVKDKLFWVCGNKKDKELTTSDFNPLFAFKARAT